MISTLKEVRDALDDACGGRCNAEYNPCWQRQAIDQLDALIAQEKAEPVAWITPDGVGFRIRFSPPTEDVPLGWDALYAAPSTSPLTDEELRDAFEHHWFLTRGKKKFVHELQRHPDQPQIYVADNANRHWVTWQAAHKIGAKT